MHFSFTKAVLWTFSVNYKNSKYNLYTQYTKGQMSVANFEILIGKITPASIVLS